MMTTCIGNALKRRVQNLRRDVVIAPWWKERIITQRHTEATANRKENSKGEQHNELPRDSLGERYSLSSPQQSSPMQLHCVKKLNISNHWHRRQTGEACSTPFSSICHSRNFPKTGLSVQSPSSSDNDKLKVATVVRQIMRELSEAVSEEDRAVIVTMMVLDLMQLNG
jgi:hypothetical protein